MSDLQDKLLPLYFNGEHIGTIRVDEACMSARMGELELRSKGQGRKFRYTAAHLIVRKLSHNSACTIKRHEVEINAFVHEGVRLTAKDSIASIESALAKVRLWPESHDTKAVMISAGKALGVIFCPSMEERVVTFA